MLPVVSAVWSAGETVSLAYPARYLFTFLHHHGMLAVTGSPQWRTVVGGSRTLRRGRRSRASPRCAVSTPVRALARTGAGVEIRDDADTVHHADVAVVATHPDQALALLAAPTAAERAVLGAFRYSRNDTLLHTDTSVLPRGRGARASWNYLKTTCAVRRRAGARQLRHEPPAAARRARRLRRDAERRRPRRPAPVIATMHYEHPIYTPESVAAQRRLPELNDGTLAFAGAYHGWGFHEDGCAAGVRAAASLGVDW